MGRQHGVKVYGPPTSSKHKTDPYAPRPDDGPGVAAWRRRMKSPHGKSVYKRRAMGECINARFRQWDLRQFTVRGRDKVQRRAALVRPGQQHPRRPPSESGPT